MAVGTPSQPPEPRHSPLNFGEAATFLQAYHNHLAGLVETHRTRAIGFLGSIGGILWAVALLDFSLFVPLLFAVGFYLTSLLVLVRKRVPEYPPSFAWIAIGDLLMGAGIADILVLLQVTLGGATPQLSTYFLMLLAAAALWFPAWGFESAMIQVMTFTPLALALDRHSWSVASGDSKSVDETFFNIMSVLEWYWNGNLLANRWLLLAFLGKDGRKQLLGLTHDQQRDVLNDWMVRRYGNLAFSQYVARHTSPVEAKAPE